MILRAGIVLFLFYLTLPCAFGQSKQELEKARKKLIRDIELTSAQLQKNARNQEATLQDLSLINTQLEKRQELIDILTKERTALQSKAALLRDSVTHISNQLADQKTHYAFLLNKAHISARMKHPFEGMMEGGSIFEGFKKWIYMGQLKKYVLRKWDQMQLVQSDLEVKKANLDRNISEQNAALKRVRNEESKISQRQSEKKKLLDRLQKDTKKMKADLEKKNKERDRLNKEIERLILAELSRKRAEETEASRKADRALSADFKSNKGRLPWPVTNGVITGKFGRQGHPDLPGVYIDNSGLDFLTKEGSEVYATFGGQVVGTTKMPGGLYMVVVAHGGYFTVYSKMVSVNVSNGQTVRTGQSLGVCGASRDGTGNFHFEVWEGKKKQNPQTWILK